MRRSYLENNADEVNGRDKLLQTRCLLTSSKSETATLCIIWIRTGRMDVDPLEALHGFEQALNSRKVKTQAGEIDRSVRVHLDYPDGSTPRFSYALTKSVGNFTHGSTKVRAMALVVNDQPHNGLPCFQVAYATAEDERNRGLAKYVLRAALAELLNGMSRNSVKRFYAEAVVPEDNVVFQRVADSLLVGVKEARRDSNGEAVVHYLKLIE